MIPTSLRVGFSIALDIVLIFNVYRRSLDGFSVLSIPILLFGKKSSDSSENQYQWFLQSIDIWRLAIYILTVCIFTVEMLLWNNESLMLFIFRDVLPNLVLLIETMIEVRSLRSEGFINTIPLLGLLLLDVIEGSALIDKYMRFEAKVFVFKFFVNFVVLMIYRGFIRDVDQLKNSYGNAFGVDMSSLLNEQDISLPDTEKESTNQHQESPEDKVGLASKLMFHWLDEVMRVGYKRPLEEKDLYDLMKEDKTQYRRDKYQEAFENELKSQNRSIHYFRSYSTEKRETSYFMLLKVISKSGALKGFLFTIFLDSCYCFCSYAPPQLLRHVLLFMNDPGASTSYGLLLIFLLFFISIVQTFIDSYQRNINLRQYVRIRGLLQTAIYDKCLRLTEDSKQTQTIGQISNFMTTDVHRVTMLLYHPQTIVSAILNLILVTYFLYQELGYATFVAESIVLLTIPLTGFIARRIDTSQDALMKVRDQRIKLTTQMLSSIKALKFYAWDKVFRERIQDIRLEELTKLKDCIYWELVTNFVWPMNFILVTFATFATYTIVEGKALDSATTFTTLSLLSLLRYPLSAIPQVIVAIIESRVSIKRVSGYLLSEETVTENIKRGEHDTIALSVNVPEAFWDDANRTRALQNIDFSIKKGDFCFVTGLVGSGKSALLKLLLNELSLSSNIENEINVNGSVAYTNQVPWVQNATVKENILFGKPYEKDWYERVVYACALTDDLNQLPLGDSTEIGERGINLSGGQKARLALARAVYSKHDILLLESCFEAVDEHVGDHLWQHCFLELLKGKCTVVCVTHAIRRLHQVDNLIVMTEGTIVGHGSFETLQREGHKDFIRLVKTLEEQEIAVTQQKGIEKIERSKELTVKGDGSGKELTGNEEKKTGSVSYDVYKAYLTAAGGLPVALATCFLYIGVTALNFVNTRWLAYSSDHFEATPNRHNLDTSPHFRSLLLPHEETKGVTSHEFLEVYAVIAVSRIFFLLGSTASIFYGGYQASKQLHNSVLFKVIRSSMSFFDTTPNGRIINRFAKDMNMVDEELPYTFMYFVQLAFDAVGIIFSVGYVTPQFLVCLPFAWIVYHRIQKFYITSQREMQRLTSVLKSPVYSFFQETLEGLSTVRGYGRENDFGKRSVKQIEQLNRANYLSNAFNRWLSVRIQLTGNVIRTVAGALIVLNRDSIGAGLAGLAFTFSFNITDVLNWGVRMIAFLETELVSVERLIQYMELPSEAPEAKSVSFDLNEWPKTGKLQIEGVCARYRDGLPLVLKGIDLVVEAGEKVGIVGRTGAGKSSLFLVLMRLVEPSTGRVLIDGVDLQCLGTLQLRSKVAVIPQDPMLFAGSIKFNLDPSNSYSDEEIINALRICCLHESLLKIVEEENKKSSEESSKEEDDEITFLQGYHSDYPELVFKLSESGTNLSFGQRQLLCIARAILKNCKILLLDEATSGIDLATDAIVQETIRTQFKEKTVLTIAHRIETIISGDKVAVMDEGLIAEYDTPESLLENENSLFSNLVQAMQAT